MAQTAPADRPAIALSQNLLLSLAEQLKVPLIQIARQAEYGVVQDSTSALPVIETVADGALKLVDAYILAVQLANQTLPVFDTEPVSVSSVLYDASVELSPIARAYDVAIDMRIDGKFGPVMANRRALQTALVSLGYALVESLPASDTSQLRLQFAAHRCRYGIVAGVYCDAENLSAQTLRQGRRLYGRARQPLTQVSPSSGAGIFVADAILQSMQTQLTTSRHHNLHGLAVVLQPNPQLQLI